MKQPSPALLPLARVLLALEASRGEEIAVAAGGVLDKLRQEISPLLGGSGFLSLILRSARLARFPVPQAVAGADSAALRGCLQAMDPAAAAEAAAGLFGTFLTLLTTFIGERLTTQVLRRAWPALPPPPPRDTP